MNVLSLFAHVIVCSLKHLSRNIKCAARLTILFLYVLYIVITSTVKSQEISLELEDGRVKREKEIVRIDVF